MLKRKNPDAFQSGSMGPPAKRQTLNDITNNVISDPKCTIVPRSPIKLKEKVVVTANVKAPETKIVSVDNKSAVFSPMLFSPDTNNESNYSCDTTDMLTPASFMSVESNSDKKLNKPSPHKEQEEATQSLKDEKETQGQEEELCQIDIQEKSNPFYAWEYAGNIHTYMLRQEQRHKPTPYLTRHPKLTLSMRQILVDWMVELQESFELYHETLYLAVRLMDRYLSRSREVSKDKLQLLSACCMLIACKYEEVKVPSLEEFVFICADAYERVEFVEMEKSICKQLDYDINTPVAYRFLRRYHKASKQDMELHTLARYIAELTLLDYTMCLELPSQVALSCLYIALRMHKLSWGDGVQQVSGVKEQDVLPLAERINCIFLKAYHTERSLNVKSKYAHNVFFQVALKRPLISLSQKPQGN